MLDTTDEDTIFANYLGFIKNPEIGWLDYKRVLISSAYKKDMGRWFSELEFSNNWNWLVAVKDKVERSPFVYEVSTIVVGQSLSVRITPSLKATFDIFLHLDTHDNKSKYELIHKALLMYVIWENENKHLTP